MPTKDHYTWLETQLRLQAAAILAGAAKNPPDDDNGKRLCLAVVTARSGIFEHPPTRSANDLAAMRLLLLLILLLIYANSRAKMREPQPFSREIRGAAICRDVTAEPAWLLAALVLAALLARCQNDHLPTAAVAFRGAQMKPANGDGSRFGVAYWWVV